MGSGLSASCLSASRRWCADRAACAAVRELVNKMAPNLTTALLHYYTHPAAIAQIVGNGANPMRGCRSVAPTPAYLQPRWGAHSQSGARLAPWQVGRLARPHDARPDSPST